MRLRFKRCFSHHYPLNILVHDELYEPWTYKWKYFYIKSLRLESFQILSTFSLLSNLFLYSRKKLSRKYTPPQHILKRLLKDINPWAYIRYLVVPYYNHCVDSTSLSFYETCNLMEVAVWCKYGYFPHIFRRSFDRQPRTAAIINKLAYFEKQPLAKKMFLQISQNSQGNTCVRVSFLTNL